MTKWAVETVDYYDSECYRDTLEMGLSLFDTRRDAIRELNRVILDDWTTEVDVDGEKKMLADCQGMSETDSVKYSSWYYSGDGTIAWAFYPSGGGHKAEVFEIDVDQP